MSGTPSEVDSRRRQAPLAVGLALGLLLWVGVTTAAAAAQVSFCKVCHSEVEVQHRGSAHAAEEITCVSCHGGDASSTEIEAAHVGDFRGAFEKAEISQFCGSCHADPALMRPYGLPSDQLALFQTSQHGRQLAQGDMNVAVCTDCHGTHGILSSAHPRSPTYSLNIAGTCGKCHSSGADETSLGPLEAFGRSVHARGLRSGSQRAPDCARCHGSHGAVPLGVGDMGKVCGQCHTEVREAYRLSPHATILEAGECTACHEHHETATPAKEQWATICADCHEATSTPVRTGITILALLDQAYDQMGLARQAMEQARGVPLDVSDYEARLEVAATYLQQARNRSHTLDTDALDEITRKARSIAAEVTAETHQHMRVLKGRSFTAIAIWIYILITIGAIQLYKRLSA